MEHPFQNCIPRSQEPEQPFPGPVHGLNSGQSFCLGAGTNSLGVGPPETMNGSVWRWSPSEHWTQMGSTELSHSGCRVKLKCEQTFPLFPKWILPYPDRLLYKYCLKVKKYMKKTNLVAEGRYLALSIPLPSPPSWLLVWSPASPTSAPLCIVAPFAARAPCPGTGDRVGQDLLVSFPLHSPKITPELHEELWTSYHLPLFPYCSLPCTIFNFKVFLHYLKCNLWVFNQVTKLFQELQKKTDKYTSRLSPRQLSGTHSNRMLIIMLKS